MTNKKIIARLAMFDIPLVEELPNNQLLFTFPLAQGIIYRDEDDIICMKKKNTLFPANKSLFYKTKRTVFIDIETKITVSYFNIIEDFPRIKIIKRKKEKSFYWIQETHFECKNLTIAIMAYNFCQRQTPEENGIFFDIIKDELSKNNLESF